MTTTDDKSPATEKPVWLITGCSTGFGRESAKQVPAARDIILATESKQPPHRLSLGADAHDGAVGKLDRLRSEFRQGEAVARAAHRTPI